MNGALAGIRVLDLTTNIAGPCATMILAHLGATVLKIERPDDGDDARHMAPFHGPWSAYFLAINRGKRSVAVDLRRPEGRQILLRLAERADVFIENMRGGKAAALGLDETSVRTVRPDIVYASLSAYGPRGPEREKAGYDALLQARTGIVSVTGEEGSAGARAGISLLDMGTGIWGALGVLAALFEHGRTGRGQRVDGSLFQTGVSWMAYHLLARQFTGRDPRPQGMRHEAFSPYGEYPTADGVILIGVSNDRLFARLCRAIGQSALADDLRFTTNALRVEHRAALDEQIASLLRARTTSAWLRRFDEEGVPSSAVQTTGQLLEDPQLAALGQMETVALPDLAAVLSPGLPLQLSEHQGDAALGPPPRLGEHTAEALGEAGFSAAEIDELARRGVVALDTTEAACAR